MRHAVSPAAGPGSQERVGPWSVTWRAAGFCVRGPDGVGNASFPFSRLILPVEIVLDDPTDVGGAVLRLDPFAPVEVLKDSPRPDLMRFKRRVSAEVLAAAQARSPYACADCAREAALPAGAWSLAVCPACREFYCGACLRRLRVAVLRGGARLCKFCGAENPPGASRHRLVHLL